MLEVEMQRLNSNEEEVVGVAKNIVMEEEQHSEKTNWGNT